MKIFSKRTLREFWEQPIYADSEQPLRAWHDETEEADWGKPSDIKALYRNVSILKSGRVVFNIHGNTYRLVVKINYDFKSVLIKFIGTHEQYDKIDANKV